MNFQDKIKGDWSMVHRRRSAANRSAEDHKSADDPAQSQKNRERYRLYIRWIPYRSETFHKSINRIDAVPDDIFLDSRP